MLTLICKSQTLISGAISTILLFILKESEVNIGKYESSIPLVASILFYGALYFTLRSVATSAKKESKEKLDDAEKACNEMKNDAATALQLIKGDGENRKKAEERLIDALDMRKNIAQRKIEIANKSVMKENELETNIDEIVQATKNMIDKKHP